VTASRAGALLVRAGSLAAAVVTVHSLVNLALLRRPEPGPARVRERVSVLVPARDEERHVGGLLADLRAQTGVDDLEVLVLDDASGDGTRAVLDRAAALDRRVRVLTGTGPPPGWLGKAAACDRLAAEATGQVLVLVDADVRLAPHAVAATVGVLRTHGLDLVSPYPRQVAETVAERLVQPLLQWSWASLLPLRVAERTPRPSLSAANGQLMAVDARAYRRAGGHAAVRTEVLDDVALVRRIKATGGRGGVADGTHLATCRMYDDRDDLVEGWSKSLWSATGHPLAAAALVGAAAVTYVLPAVAALRGSRWGAAGYAAAVIGRAVVAQRTGGRVHDAWTHPASVVAWSLLVARSWRGRRAGSLTWKGRALADRSPDPAGAR
jgi:hypothetical protein